MTVWSCKTEHNAGGDRREIPLYDELVTPLLDALESMPPGAEYVVWRYRDNATNLRTQLERIIDKAGLKRWPKLYQNMRSSRQTELLEAGHPLQSVCAWLGNSQQVALAHYAQVRDEHFEAAAAKGDLAARASGFANCAPQNAPLHASERPRNRSQSHSREGAQVPEIQRPATPCGTLRASSMTPWGFEPQFLG